MMEKIKNLSKKSLTSIALVILVIFGIAYPLSTINPGFEGIKCNVYGVDFRFTDQSHSSFGSWEGTNQLHKYQDAGTETWLCRKGSSATGQYWDIISWSNVATPNDVAVRWEYGSQIISNRRRYPDLGIHVEQNPQLQDITKQGTVDPLGYNSEDPLEGRRIEYWGLKGVKTTETEDKVVYEYELTKESFLIVPTEFWVGFYLVPSQSGAGTASGWCEGEWKDMTAWFRLDFHVWDNAYYDDWFDDPKAEVFTSEYGGIVTSQEKLVSPDSYRGGFPIAGWIQGWEKAGWTSDVVAGEQQSPIWYDIRGSETGTYTDDQVAELRESLMAKCEFSPGMVGQMVCLYDEPSSSFSYDTVQPSFTDFENTQGMTNTVKAPDSGMKKTMYFPINIQNFGTYAEDLGWWGLSGWKVYYPSAYFRVRMIYGVYGNFKYLWTEEVTKSLDEGGLDFPEEIERHGTTVITATGALTPFGGIASWFSNPFNQLWTLFIIMVIVILAVTILNPGLWGSLVSAYKGRPQSKSFRRKKK